MSILRKAAQDVIDCVDSPYIPDEVRMVDVNRIKALREALQAEPEKIRPMTEAEAVVMLNYCIAFMKSLGKKFDGIGEQAETEPVAWINVEARRLEWNTDFPLRWETPTIVKLDKLPLYTLPPSVDALIAEAIEKHDDEMAYAKTVNMRTQAQPYLDELIAEIDALPVATRMVKTTSPPFYKTVRYHPQLALQSIMDKYRSAK